jgi:hypothetical protein
LADIRRRFSREVIGVEVEALDAAVSGITQFLQQLFE